jgi:transposase
MKTGPKVSFNREELVADLKAGMSYAEAMQKHNVTYRTVSNYRSRYLNNKAVRVPKVEKALRALERLESRFDKETLREAFELL